MHAIVYDKYSSNVTFIYLVFESIMNNCKSVFDIFRNAKYDESDCNNYLVWYIYVSRLFCFETQ